MAVVGAVSFSYRGLLQGASGSITWEQVAPSSFPMLVLLGLGWSEGGKLDGGET